MKVNNISFTQNFNGLTKRVSMTRHNSTSYSRTEYVYNYYPFLNETKEEIANNTNKGKPICINLKDGVDKNGNPCGSATYNSYIEKERLPITSAEYERLLDANLTYNQMMYILSNKFPDCTAFKI